MVKSNTTIMIVGILVALIFTALPCLEAQSPMGAPVMSPGSPNVMAPSSPTVMSPSSPTAMAPGPDCLTALANVSDCLGFVQVGSNLTVPDKNCCPEFAGLLESNPICLCTMIDQAEAYSIDLSRALMLPDVCKVSVPSLDSCPATPASAPAPGTASEIAPPTASELAPGATTAGPGPAGGEALSPTESSGSNGTSGTTVHDLSTIICLAVAIFVAYYI
ncbi:putative bifunctional inhibitor/plant lipid transfer protein/seed storage helical [Helianthus annuus]|nr:putative bifunctional inhibitor/plant lipid transfer protein/seed storage helical [Helianthus annuus]KAJ0883118.1 putative bifunctional inhibitor/plant lipid transfer protein/seed storage helical [Helianthus annuus]